MSEQGEEKTEQPTPKKIKDAREKGQVAQSKELTSAVAMIVLISALVIGYEGKLSLYVNNFEGILELIRHNQLGFDVIYAILKNSMSIAEHFLLLPIALAAILSFFINVAQIKGLMISKEAFKFDLKKLNPIDNFKSTFSKKNFIKFARQCIEIIVMSIVAYMICTDALDDILKVYVLSIKELSFYIAVLLLKLFLTLFVIHVIFAISDYILESRNLMKQLMMSMHDIKEEFKNTEGNPEIKYERKRLHREMLEDDGMFGSLAESSILLANPTHIAVIVTFMPDKVPLPFVLFKASGADAVDVIDRASNAGMIVERDVYLARKLFEIADVGKVVPKSLLQDVADVFGKNLHKMPVLHAKFTNMLNPVKQNTSRVRV